MTPPRTQTTATGIIRCTTCGGLAIACIACEPKAAAMHRTPTPLDAERLARAIQRIAQWREWEADDARKKDFWMADRWRHMATGAEDALATLGLATEPQP
jgi:hypothetical protein